MLGAGVVLRAPDGSRQEPVVMRELAEGSDRYGGDVTVRSTGMWQFHVEAWGDPSRAGSMTRPSRSRWARMWS